MPILTLRLSAWAISGRQTSRNRGQLSSTDSAGSRPTNVLTTPDAQRRRGVDHLAEVRHGELRLGRIGRERVRVIAQPRDRHLLDRGQVLDLLDRVRATGRWRRRASRRHSGARPCPAASTSARRSRSRRPARSGTPAPACSPARSPRRIRVSWSHLAQWRVASGKSQRDGEQPPVLRLARSTCRWPPPLATTRPRPIGRRRRCGRSPRRAGPRGRRRRRSGSRGPGRPPALR